jgi:hypothetical protein
VQTQNATAAPPSAVPPHILEQQRKLELLKRARVIKERVASRRQELEGLDPSKQYMWVNVREDRQMFFQALGYVVAQSQVQLVPIYAPGEKPLPDGPGVVQPKPTGHTLKHISGVNSPYLQNDGMHRRADVILYEIDRDLYEALYAADVMRGIENIEAASESFQLSLMRDGVKTFKPPVK